MDNQVQVPNQDLDISSLKTGISEDKIVGLVLSNNNDADTYLQSSGYTQDWKEYNDLYRGIPETKPYVWMSNKFIPMTLSKLETAVANIMGYLFSVNPPIEVKPFETGDVDQARLMQKLLKYQFESNIEYEGVYWEFLNLVKSACIFGTGISKIYWETKWNNQLIQVPQYEPMMSILNMPIGKKFVGNKTESKPVKVFDAPIMKTLNLNDIKVDPQSINVQDSWIIHITHRTISYLKQMSKYYPEVYNNNVDLISIEGSDETKSNLTGDGTQTSMGKNAEPSVAREKSSNRKKVYEWWGEYDIKGDGEPIPCVFTVCDNRLIRKQANPFLHQKNPFVKCVYIPELNDFYGIGLVEIERDLQHLLNETINQRIDNLSLALNTPIRYKKNSGINPQKLVMKPGGLYGSEDMNDIVFERIPFNANDSFVQASEIERWAQEVSGITKLTLGMGGSDQNQTATGMNILAQASANRLGIIARLFENTGLKEIAKMFYQLDYQFLEDEEIRRILGKEMPAEGFMLPSPEVISKNYDFIPAGVFTMDNRQGKALRLIQFANIYRGHPRFKEDSAMKKIYSLMDIGDDPAEMVRTDDEMLKYFEATMGLQNGIGANMQGQPQQPGIKQTPGMGGQGIQNGTQVPNEVSGGNVTSGTPGMPPVNTGIAPGERV